MVMRYCADCGNGHECESAAASEMEARVQIARIEADRDIKIAQYGARTAETVAELEAEAGADHAEGVAEGMETVLEIAAGGAADPAEGAPIIVDEAPELEAEAEPELEAEPENAPPVVVDIPPVKGKGGYWDMYR